MPFNTLLWRVVVLTPDGYLEGYRSLAVDKKPMTLTAWPSNTPALRELAATPDVGRLLWFTSGFMGAREVTVHTHDLEHGLAVLGVAGERRLGGGDIGAHGVGVPRGRCF